jgi:alpha-beta hydrolase superfamily lysophospholipase
MPSTPATTAATGKTAGVLAKRAGFFAEHGTAGSTVVEDMYAVTRTIRDEQPGLPIFLFGHSMGSMLSRTYAIRHGAELAGLILSGTGGDPGMLGKVGQVVARSRPRSVARARQSPLLDKTVVR